MPNTNWLEISDLTIFEAAFWMQMNSDPWAHEYRCECDPEYKYYFDDNPNGRDAVYEKCFVLESLIRTGGIETTKEIYGNQKLDYDLTRINKSDWLKWCYHNGYKERFAPAVIVETEPIAPTVTDPLEQAPPAAKVQDEPESQTKEPKPWLIANTADPSPDQPWYTPARYFARQLVENDSTLLTKPDLLADKVLQSLNKAGILKRGGKKRFSSSDTMKKAFVNVTLG